MEIEKATGNEKPNFREFRQDSRSLTDEKGLWAILDSVARIPARMDPSLSSTFDDPATATFAADLKGLSGQAVSAADAAVDSSPEVPPDPPLPNPPPVRPVVPDTSGTIADGDFGRLFRRRPDMRPAASTNGPMSLKDILKRVS